jgi:hypothetical protein
MLPLYVVVLPRVEVKPVKMTRLARPNNGPAKRSRKTGFKIHAASLEREIGNDKLRFA